MEDNCEDSWKRRSSHSIKSSKFDDELVESILSAEFGSPSPKSQCARTQSLKSTSTSLVQNIPETIIPFIMPSTSTTLPLNISSNRMSTSTSNHFAGTPSTSTVPPSTNRNRSRKQKNVNKVLGLWKPTDDLMLIHSIIQTHDLQMVHRGVKFSCRFTLKEITQRWYALLYDPKISRLAVSAMHNLDPETIANIESKVLFSVAEEELLATIQSNSQPIIETFQELLTQNPNIFHRKRTAKTLMGHWQIMKKYSLLSDQCSALENPISLSLMSSLKDRIINIINKDLEVTTLTTEDIPTFGERKELLNDFKSLLNEETDSRLDQHLSLTNKKDRKEMKVLENESPTAQVLVFPMTGNNPIEFEPQTLAVLCGRLVKYLMRSKKITIGRSSKYQQVDVDLKLEGSAWKISRRQATISLHKSSVFLITCEGKKCLYVDGKPLAAGSRSRLNHNSVVEISGLRFVFLINHQFEGLQQQSDKLEQRLKLLEAEAENNQWQQNLL